MALEVEDGSGKTNSETLMSEDDFVDFCSRRGITITSDQSSIHLVKAMDWIIDKEPSLNGERSVEGQALPFPRKDLNINNRVVADDEVPTEARYAQAFAAVASFNGFDLFPSIEAGGRREIRKKTGPIEHEYQFTGGSASPPVVPQAASYLGLMRRQGFKFNQRA